MTIRPQEMRHTQSSRPRREGERYVADFGVNGPRPLFYQGDTSNAVQDALRRMEEGWFPELAHGLYRTVNEAPDPRAMRFTTRIGIPADLLAEHEGVTKAYLQDINEIDAACRIAVRLGVRRYGPSTQMCECGRADCWVKNPLGFNYVEATETEADFYDDGGA